MRQHLLLFFFVVLVGAVGGAACGAQNVEAPPAPLVQAQESCGSFESLMPTVVAALEAGRTEGLKVVIREHLLVSERPGQPPPMNDVMRAIFTTLARFAASPAEVNSPPGEVCSSSATPPAVEQSHPLCEMRRAMRTLVHEGEGLALLSRVDPLISAVLRYVVGQAPVADKPHFEVAGVLSGMCSQTAVCRMEDTLDLGIALTEVLKTARGKQMLERISTLANDPALKPFLTDDGQQYGGENGMVALTRVILTTVRGMDGPEDLDALPLNQLPTSLQGPLESVLGDLKVLLHPNAQPNVLRPLKRVLNCHQSQDANLELVRLVYQLGMEADLPEFGAQRFLQLVTDLAAKDERSTLAHLANVLLKAVREDEQAVDSLAKVCATLFSTQTSASQPRSNAELALPVVAELFEQGIAREGLCAVDTLVYGCGGGERLACESTPPPAPAGRPSAINR